jgi:site-specific DNA-methyltransferase (cytosine-N4-specific)
MHNGMAPSAQTRKLTRLSTIHPYPAMIADELALALARKYVDRNTRAFDPFSGTCRTLMAAAAQGAECLGMDVNPLAVLIARAKLNKESPNVEQLLLRSRDFRTHVFQELQLQPGRKVTWFSQQTCTELTQIINWLNSEQLTKEVRTFLAAILSATTREVSYCRKDQWKLHRMPQKRRTKYVSSPWEVFERRLRRATLELDSYEPPTGQVSIHLGDSTRSAILRRCVRDRTFNLVVTSPPYGDSRSTVSYGDVSSLCLGVLQHLTGLNIPFISSSDIDEHCLGGRQGDGEHDLVDTGRYWRGGRYNPARSRVDQFLSDLYRSCAQTVSVMDKKSRAVFVISRRKVGGRRLYLDRFLSDVMDDLGFQFEGMQRRRLEGKNTPLFINAGGSPDVSVLTRTMREELILSFSRS